MILARKTFCLTHNLTLASVVKVISTKFINKFGWCRCSLFLKDQKLQQLWEGLNWEPNIPCSYLTYWAIRLNKWIRYTRISNLMSCWSKLKYFSSNIRQLPLNPSNPMTLMGQWERQLYCIEVVLSGKHHIFRIWYDRWKHLHYRSPWTACKK